MISFCLGFETSFEKRAFGMEMDPSELLQFFRDCELSPSITEIDEAVDAVFRGTQKQRS